MQMDDIRAHLFTAYRNHALECGDKAHVQLKGDLGNPALTKSLLPDGTLVLNISNTATRDLVISNTGVTFKMRIQGSPMDVAFCWKDVLAMQSGMGMHPIDAHLITTPQGTMIGFVTDEPEVIEPSKDRPNKGGLQLVK